MWWHWVTWCGCPAVPGDAVGVFPLVAPRLPWVACLPVPVCVMCDVTTCGETPADCSSERCTGGKPPCRASLGRYKAIDNGDVVRNGRGLTDKLGDRPDVWVGVSLGLQALRTRGPPVTKRGRPKKRFLSSLYLCLFPFSVSSVMHGVIDDVVRLFFFVFGSQDLALCRTQYSVHSKVMSGKY